MVGNEDAVWNRFAPIYDRFMKKDMDVYRKMIEKITQGLNPEDRVLEVATGTGIISLGLSGHIRQIDAVDQKHTGIRQILGSI